MYEIAEFPEIDSKKNYFILSTPKSICNQMEKDLHSFINLIRKKPSEFLKYLSNNENIELETEQLFNYINNLSLENISFPPLIKTKEITNISRDLLNYIINLKRTKGEIKYDLIENNDVKLKRRAGPNIIIRGKYYEGIVLESSNLVEIISYILKDIKGRSVFFNAKIKYIGIACGIIEINNCKICTIIDLIQDFENYDYIIEKRYEYKTKEIDLRNNYMIPKSFSYDKITKRKIKRKRYNNNLIKDNTYDNILINNKKNILLNNKEKEKEKLIDNNNTQEKPKTSITIPSIFSKINSKNKIPIKKTEDSSDLNKIYNNNFCYSSKHENVQNKIEEKKENDNTSENNGISSASFSKQKSKKKLNQEEKIELLKQINKESREKSKKKKSAIKTDDDSKSVSFTTKKNNVSNDASFSEIISIDNDKKIKEKININKLKSELKEELKNEVKEELKIELENKMSINNKLKVPLLNLFNNEYSNDIGLNNNNKNNTIDIKGMGSINYTNRSINSIDIFIPSIKNNNSSINYSEEIPGLIDKENNINNNNSREIKKDNIIIKKFVKLNGINNNTNKKNKTPDKSSKRNFAFINKSPYARKKNFIYHKIPFANNNIFFHNIAKNNIKFNSKTKTSQNKKFTGNINNLNYFQNSPRTTHKESLLTFKKIIVKNINNDNNSKLNKSGIEKIIKIPKKIINNLNYIDNNKIIINNKTKNIVYVKQNSPSKMKSYEINNVYKKKFNF